MLVLHSKGLQPCRSVEGTRNVCVFVCVCVWRIGSSHETIRARKEIGHYENAIRIEGRIRFWCGFVKIDIFSIRREIRYSVLYPWNTCHNAIFSPAHLKLDFWRSGEYLRCCLQGPLGMWVHRMLLSCKPNHFQFGILFSLFLVFEQWIVLLIKQFKNHY